MPPLKQLIPSEICLKCQVCCRFPTPESDMFPVFMKEEFGRLLPEYQSFFKSPLRPISKSYHGIGGQTCACPFFNPTTHECIIYRDRPLDCQLYPFVLTFGPTQKRVFLGLDTQCPFVQDIANHEALLGFGDSIHKFLEEAATVEAIAKNPELIGHSDETIFPFYPLSGLTEKLFQTTLFGNPPPPSLGLIPIALKDRERIEKFFSASAREFSEESFVPLIAFSDLLHFYWKIDEEVLFIVAGQGNHFFMPVPPVTQKQTSKTLEAGFALLAQLNPQGRELRIEGLSEESSLLSKTLGCTIYSKSPEYLYRREDLAALSGDAYKSKRSLCNYFSKNYSYRYEPYRSRDFSGCFHLFRRWQEKRCAKTTDDYERALLEDAVSVHRRVLLHARALGMEGRVITLGGEIKGYTFGYPLGDQTWCIFLEIADVSVKGLAQFLFREFCREKKEFVFVNGMDDSGLERLRQVKESYKPFLKKIPYVAVRKEI